MYKKGKTGKKISNDIPGTLSMLDAKVEDDNMVGMMQDVKNIERQKCINYLRKLIADNSRMARVRMVTSSEDEFKNATEHVVAYKRCNDYEPQMKKAKI